MKVKENTLEIRRQAAHILLGLTLVLLIEKELIGWEILTIIVLTGLVLSVLSRKYRIPVIAQLLDYLERAEVRKTTPGKGILFFVLGVLIVVVFFQKEIALAAIMILTLGDSVSHLFGRFFGKIPHPWNDYKLIEGTMLGFVAGTVGAAAFVPLTAAVVGSAVAMVVEGIELRLKRTTVDDNLLIPIIAAVVIYFLV